MKNPLALVFILLFACNAERPNVAAPATETGQISLQLTYAWSGKLAQVDRMTVYLHQSGEEIQKRNLTHNGDRGQGILTVPVGSYVVTVASFESDLINMMGSATVNVTGGSTTEANIVMASVVPSNLRITGEDDSIVIQWDAVSQAQGFLLQEDESFDFGSPIVVHQGTTSSKRLSRDTGDYFYRVQSSCDIGYSRWSQIAHVSVGAASGSIEVDIPWDTTLDLDVGTALKVVGTPKVVQGDNYSSIGWSPGDFGGDARITGEIQNTGSEDATNVTITVTLRDGGGNLLGRVRNHSVGTVMAGDSAFFAVIIETVFSAYQEAASSTAEVTID